MAKETAVERAKRLKAEAEAAEKEAEAIEAKEAEADANETSEKPRQKDSIAERGKAKYFTAMAFNTAPGGRRKGGIVGQVVIWDKSPNGEGTFKVSPAQFRLHLEWMVSHNMLNAEALAEAKTALAEAERLTPPSQRGGKVTFKG